MNAEQQKEFDIKKKFVLYNQKEFLAGGVVPGYEEAMLWLKQTKMMTVDKKAEEAKKEEIRRYIEAQKKNSQ